MQLCRLEDTRFDDSLYSPSSVVGCDMTGHICQYLCCRDGDHRSVLGEMFTMYMTTMETEYFTG